MTVGMLERITNTSNPNAILEYGRRIELRWWPVRQQGMSWTIPHIRIPMITVPMMILRHYIKGGLYSIVNKQLLFLFLYQFFSSRFLLLPLSITVTHLLHVVPLLRNRKARGGSMSKCPFPHLGFSAWFSTAQPQHNNHSSAAIRAHHSAQFTARPPMRTRIAIHQEPPVP